MNKKELTEEIKDCSTCGTFDKCDCDNCLDFDRWMSKANIL